MVKSKGESDLSRYIHKSHNVTVLMYHIVCPTKYRKVVIDENVDITIVTNIPTNLLSLK